MLPSGKLRSIKIIDGRTGDAREHNSAHGPIPHFAENFLTLGTPHRCKRPDPFVESVADRIYNHALWCSVRGRLAESIEMLRCLFWNLGRKDLAELIGQAAKTMRLDMLIFCEIGSPSKRTLQSLNQTDAYHFTTGRVGQRFHIFTRFPNRYVGVRREADRFLILDIDLPARDRFLMMVLHGPSKKAGWTSTALSLEFCHYASALRNAQSEHAVSRSVIVGDFNVNPFESGLVSASAFNAVMDARQARKGSRTVQKRNYGYFYNPMWNLLGDATPGPPASFFYDQSTQDELQWHMLDQVILSPEMIDSLDIASVRILDKIGDVPLVTKTGRPRKARFSDHLPLYFELDP